MKTSYLCLGAIMLLSSCANSGRVTEKDCHLTSGIVTDVTEGGIKDAVFQLSQNDTLFYINRALESRFNLNQLRKDVHGKNVSIYYVPVSSILSASKITSQHIYRVDVGDKVLYSEF